MKLIKYDSSKEKEENNNPLLINNWRFTCSSCKTVTEFHPKNMIFKHIEFYCSVCGEKHKVSNPALTEIKKEK